jgi:hypothetical protein
MNVYSRITQTGKFKANSGILAPYMRGVVNPHDEIKGSIPLPALFSSVIANTHKPRRAKILHQDLEAQISTTDNYEYLYL